MISKRPSLEILPLVTIGDFGFDAKIELLMPIFLRLELSLVIFDAFRPFREKIGS